jgi:hypothetical protein
MFRFTIRDVFWLMVVVGLLLVLWNERNAYQSAKLEKEDMTFWAKSLEHGIEAEGYYIAGAKFGIADLVPVPADKFPAGLSMAERRRRFQEWTRAQESLEQ